MLKLSFNPVDVCQQIRTPNADHLVAANIHVGILRFVQMHTFALALVRIWETVWVTMPVVTIELDDHTDAREKSIYAKLSADGVLWNVVDAEFVQNAIADSFNRGCFYSLLLCIHLDKTFAQFRIRISTSQRAILWVALSRCGGRQPELSAAHFASITFLISALPFVMMLFGTKVVSTVSVFLNIDSFSAQPALDHFSGASSRAGLLFSIAVQRTKSLSRTQVAGCNFSAALADDGADFVSELPLHVNHYTNMELAAEQKTARRQGRLF